MRAFFVIVVKKNHRQPLWRTLPSVLFRLNVKHFDGQNVHSAAKHVDFWLRNLASSECMHAGLATQWGTFVEFIFRCFAGLRLCCISMVKQGALETV